MALVQQAPISDTANAALTSTYSNKLRASGGVGALSWGTLLPSDDIKVSSTGQVSTTGELTIGTYSVSGNVFDSQGNQGIWIFTLTVVGPISPATSVTPVQPALPSGVEI